MILATGLLGAATLQIYALRANQGGSMLGQAAILANTMVERIRANPAALESEGAFAAEHGVPAAAGADCSQQTCTREELARYDVRQWKQELARVLVSGDGEITVGPTQVEITVRWDQERTGATGVRCPPVDATDLYCFRLQVDH